MRSLFTLISFLLVATTSLKGQKAEFGAVSIEEIQANVHPLESEAQAAVIYQSGLIEIDRNLAEGYRMNSTIHRKIKIYDTKVPGWKSLKIPIRTALNGVSETVTFLEAYTYQIENGELIKTKLDNQSGSTEKLNAYLKYEVYQFPTLQDGSIIEYKYTLTTPSFKGVPKWNFQYDVPCNESNYELHIPQTLEYKERIFGESMITRKEGKESVGIANNPMTRKVLTFKLKNTPSLKEVSHVLNTDDYRMAISFEVEQSWDEIATAFNKNSRFGGQLRKPMSEYKEFLESIKGLSKLERMDTIYQLVQSEYSWNGNYGSFTEKGFTHLFKYKTGNVAQLNLLLNKLLNKAGIDAIPLISRRRQLGAIDVDYPTSYEMDYVFVVANIDGKKIYLDATDKFAKAGKLPDRALNTHGILIHHSDMVNISNMPAIGTPMYIDNQNVDLFNGFITASISKRKLIVKGSEQYEGYKASYYRSNLKDGDPESAIIDFFQQEDERQLSEGTVMNLSDLSQPVKIKSTYEKEGLMEEIGDKLYISPLLGYELTTNPHLAEERLFPIYYTAMKNERIMINLMIPEGYKVESIPEPVKLSIPEEMGSFYFNYQAVGKMLQIQCMFKINGTGFSPQYHVPLKMLYEKAIELGKQKIVLTKEI